VDRCYSCVREQGELRYQYRSIVLRHSSLCSQTVSLALLTTPNFIVLGEISSPTLSSRKCHASTVARYI
jgi:hypothetical protein